MVHKLFNMKSYCKYYHKTSVYKLYLHYQVNFIYAPISSHVVMMSIIIN